MAGGLPVYLIKYIWRRCPSCNSITNFVIVICFINYNLANYKRYRSTFYQNCCMQDWIPLHLSEKSLLMLCLHQKQMASSCNYWYICFSKNSTESFRDISVQRRLKICREAIYLTTCFFSETWQLLLSLTPIANLIDDANILNVARTCRRITYKKNNMELPWGLAEVFLVHINIFSR